MYTAVPSAIKPPAAANTATVPTTTVCTAAATQAIAGTTNTACGVAPELGSFSNVGVS